MDCRVKGDLLKEEVGMDLGEKKIERTKYPLRKPEPVIPVPNWPTRKPAEVPAEPAKVPQEVPAG
jgi:hypothetical protein